MKLSNIKNQRKYFTKESKYFVDLDAINNKPINEAIIDEETLIPKDSMTADQWVAMRDKVYEAVDQLVTANYVTDNLDLVRIYFPEYYKTQKVYRMFRLDKYQLTKRGFDRNMTPEELQDEIRKIIIIKNEYSSCTKSKAGLTYVKKTLNSSKNHYLEVVITFKGSGIDVHGLNKAFYQKGYITKSQYDDVNYYNKEDELACIVPADYNFFEINNTSVSNLPVFNPVVTNYTHFETSEAYTFNQTLESFLKHEVEYEKTSKNVWERGYNDTVKGYLITNRVIVTLDPDAKDMFIELQLSDSFDNESKFPPQFGEQVQKDLSAKGFNMNQLRISFKGVDVNANKDNNTVARAINLLEDLLKYFRNLSTPFNDAMSNLGDAGILMGESESFQKVYEKVKPLADLPHTKIYKKLKDLFIRVDAPCGLKLTHKISSKSLEVMVGLGVDINNPKFASYTGSAIALGAMKNKFKHPLSPQDKSSFSNAVKDVIQAGGYGVYIYGQISDTIQEFLKESSKLLIFMSTGQPFPEGMIDFDTSLKPLIDGQKKANKDLPNDIKKEIENSSALSDDELNNLIVNDNIHATLENLVRTLIKKRNLSCAIDVKKTPNNTKAGKFDIKISLSHGTALCNISYNGDINTIYCTSSGQLPEKLKVIGKNKVSFWTKAKIAINNALDAFEKAIKDLGIYDPLPTLDIQLEETDDPYIFKVTQNKKTKTYQLKEPYKKNVKAIINKLKDCLVTNDEGDQSEQTFNKLLNLSFVEVDSELPEAPSNDAVGLTSIGTFFKVLFTNLQKKHKNAKIKKSQTMLELEVQAEKPSTQISIVYDKIDQQCIVFRMENGSNLPKDITPAKKINDLDYPTLFDKFSKMIENTIGAHKQEVPHSSLFKVELSTPTSAGVISMYATFMNMLKALRDEMGGGKIESNFQEVKFRYSTNGETFFINQKLIDGKTIYGKNGITYKSFIMKNMSVKELELIYKAWLGVLFTMKNPQDALNNTVPDAPNDQENQGVVDNVQVASISINNAGRDDWNDQLQRLQDFVKPLQAEFNNTENLGYFFIDNEKLMQKYNIKTPGFALAYYGNVQDAKELNAIPIVAKLLKSKSIKRLANWHNSTDLNNNPCFIVIFMDVVKYKELKAQGVYKDVKVKLVPHKDTQGQANKINKVQSDVPNKQDAPIEDKPVKQLDKDIIPNDGKPPVQQVDKQVDNNPKVTQPGEDLKDVNNRVLEAMYTIKDKIIKKFGGNVKYSNDAVLADINIGDFNYQFGYRNSTGKFVAKLGCSDLSIDIIPLEKQFNFTHVYSTKANFTQWLGVQLKAIEANLNKVQELANQNQQVDTSDAITNTTIAHFKKDNKDVLVDENFITYQYVNGDFGLSVKIHRTYLSIEFCKLFQGQITNIFGPGQVDFNYDVSKHGAYDIFLDSLLLPAINKAIKDIENHVGGNNAQVANNANLGQTIAPPSEMKFKPQKDQAKQEQLEKLLNFLMPFKPKFDANNDIAYFFIDNDKECKKYKTNGEVGFAICYYGDVKDKKELNKIPEVAKLIKSKNIKRYADWHNNVDSNGTKCLVTIYMEVNRYKELKAQGVYKDIKVKAIKNESLFYNGKSYRIASYNEHYCILQDSVTGNLSKVYYFNMVD